MKILLTICIIFCLNDISFAKNYPQSSSSSLPFSVQYILENFFVPFEEKDLLIKKNFKKAKIVKNLWSANSIRKGHVISGLATGMILNKILDVIDKQIELDKPIKMTENQRHFIERRLFEMARSYGEILLEIDKAREDHYNYCQTVINDIKYLSGKEFNTRYKFIPYRHSGDNNEICEGDTGSYYQYIYLHKPCIQDQLLEKEKSFQEYYYHRDHIPSKNAVKEKLNEKNNNKEYERNIDHNTSIIVIPSDIHKNSRTYGGRNDIIYKEDAKNLFLATCRDLSYTTSYIVRKYGFRKAINYLHGGYALILRNVRLCLYEGDDYGEFCRY